MVNGHLRHLDELLGKIEVLPAPDEYQVWGRKFRLKLRRDTQPDGKDSIMLLVSSIYRDVIDALVRQPIWVHDSESGERIKVRQILPDRKLKRNYGCWFYAKELPPQKSLSLFALSE